MALVKNAVELRKSQLYGAYHLGRIGASAVLYMNELSPKNSEPFIGGGLIYEQTVSIVMRKNCNAAILHKLHKIELYGS